MYREKKVAVIIAAAGSGQRMGSSRPKQFLKIGNKTLLEKATEAFENNASVDDIYVLVGAEYVTELEEFFVNGGDYTKIRAVIEGGATRQQSVALGLRTIEENLDSQRCQNNVIVLIHDAARAFVTGDLIDRVIENTYDNGAVIPAVPVKDTIKTIEKNKISETPDRSKLFAAQTPQSFSIEILKDAYSKAAEEGFVGTDDASLVERAGYDVYIIKGEETNVKITTPSDMPKNMETDSERVGLGFDVHAFAKDRDLILGGIRVPYKMGLSGHSDADVLTHAFMDAMLGAMNMGDIGVLFPDNDMTYKDISSIILLEKVVDLMTTAGYSLGNADLIIIAEEPKMKDYIPAMKDKLSESVGVESGKISIKATTTEGLGFTGRGEGIGVQAIVRLVKLS